MEYRYKAAVFIGRMQPVHKAHLEIIKIALKQAETVIISIGSAHRPRTVKNPWTPEERIDLIKKALKSEFRTAKGWSDFPDLIDSRIKFIQVRDHMYNDAKWAAETYSKAILAGATQDKSTVLIGHFKDDSSYYLKMYPQWDLHVTKNFFDLNATDIRNEMFEQDCVAHEGIPSGIVDALMQYTQSENFKILKQEHTFTKAYKELWSKAPYAPTFVTVDAVVVKSGHVLMVKRKANPGKGLFALPGGFLDPSERLQQAVIRELKEETKIKVDKPVLERSIIDSHVFDHPNRSVRGRTITHAFLIDLGLGELPFVKGSDDAEQAFWIPLADIGEFEDKTFEDHIDIIKYFTSRF